MESADLKGLIEESTRHGKNHKIQTSARIPSNVIEDMGMLTRCMPLQLVI